MARTVRNANLDTRTARLKLAKARHHWIIIDKGVALGYRRPREGNGTWTVRVLVDPAAGKYSNTRVGTADDYLDTGEAVLDYYQATRKARELVADAHEPDEAPKAPLTVKRAAELYLADFKVRKKSAGTTENVIDAHILPRFGEKLVADLTTTQVKQWHHKLATQPARLRRAKGAKAIRHRDQDLEDPDTARRRKATANRILSVFKALLNFAWHEELVPSDKAWRRVKPYKNAGEPRVRYLEPDEAARLVNASPADFRKLVRAALLTGCRYGELVALRVEDYRPEAQSVHIRDSKSGKPRHVPLTDEGVAFFETETAGRGGAEILFRRDGGSAWGTSHQARPMLAACKAATIDPPISFHILRHTYGSWLAMRGVPLQVVAEALGHADTRITQRHYGHLAPSYVAQVIRANLPSIGLDPTNVAPMRKPKRKTKGDRK